MTHCRAMDMPYWLAMRAELASRVGFDGEAAGA
jgi:hypothetical protein